MDDYVDGKKEWARSKEDVLIYANFPQQARDFLGSAKIDSVMSRSKTSKFLLMIKKGQSKKSYFQLLDAPFLVQESWWINILV